MIPNYASAIYLDSAVKAYNILKNKQDTVISIKEFVANFDAVSKNIQLLYGLSNIKPNNSEFVNDIIVFGKGLAKSSLLNNIVEIPSTSSEQFGYRLSEILGQNLEISNCYIFVAMYLINNGSTVDVAFSIAKSTLEEDGEDFILSKDIDINTAKDIVLNSSEIVFPQPSGSTQYTLLYKLIIDVEYYDGVDKNSRAFINVIDERKPRSFFSLSDERAAATITPSVFNFSDNFDYMLGILYDSLSQVVTDWINLDSWTPDFSHYWYDVEPELPNDLKNFILYDLNYDLSWQMTPTGLTSGQKFGTHGLVI